MSENKEEISNLEVVILAVYLLGGESQYIDLEDVAVKANEIAPGRFAWRKYPEQIHLESVKKRLWSAKQGETGSYLLGSEKQGWLLTEKGLEFAKNRLDILKGADLSKEPLRRAEKKWRHHEYVRLLATEAFSKCQAGNADLVTVQEAEAFFRVDDYVTGQARERKLVRILNAFGNDPALGDVVKELAKKIRSR